MEYVYALCLLWTLFSLADACASKSRHKAQCEDVLEVANFMLELQKTLMPTTPDCDRNDYHKLVPNMYQSERVMWYYGFRQNLYLDYHPKTIEEFYYMVKSDFTAVTMSVLKENMGVASKAFDDLESQLRQVKDSLLEQIEKYSQLRNINPVNPPDLPPGALEDSILYCASLNNIRTAVEAVTNEYEASVVVCDDDERIKFFHDTKRKMYAPATLLSGSVYVKKYLTNPSSCSGHSDNRIAACILDEMVRSDARDHEFQYVFGVMKKLAGKVDDLRTKVAVRNVKAGKTEDPKKQVMIGLQSSV